MKYKIFQKLPTERRENLTHSWERKMHFSDAIRWRQNKSKMADGRHIENRFSLYLGAILTDQREIWKTDDGSHAIFANSRWRTAAISKMALSPYLSR